MGNIWTNPIRHPEDVGSGFWRRRVVATQPRAATTGAIPVAAFEKGSVVTQCRAFKATAFNGTTPTVTVGTIANPSALMSSADVAPGSTGYSAGGTGPQLGQELTADTQFYVFITGTGVTAGDVDVHIHFANPRNWSDLNGGQAS